MAGSKKNGNGRLEAAMADLEESHSALAKSLAALAQAQASLVQGQAAIDQAMATLIQNQAAFVAELRENEVHRAEMKRESDARFARIESLLLEHNRILIQLPEAIREKIGFKASQ